MNAKLVLSVCLVAVFLVAGADRADAGCFAPFFSGYAISPYGYYLSGGAFDRANLPHYALFPPVYYSYVVRRPYGRSPFAYPPYGPDYGWRGFNGYVSGGPSPEQGAAGGSPPRPAVIKNPYVTGQAGSQPRVDQAASKGLRIVNPYVVASTRAEPVSVNLAEARR